MKKKIAERICTNIPQMGYLFFCMITMFDDELIEMKCPYCGEEMQSGFIPTDLTPAQWIPDGKK